MNYTSLKLKKYILILGDIAVLYLSLYLTLIVRYAELPTANLWQEHFWPFTVIFFVWLIIFYLNNLYDLTLAINNVKFYGLSANALFFNFLIGSAFFYLIPQIGITPKRNLFIDIIITAIIFILWRLVYNVILKTYLPKSNVAIIGLNDQVREIIKHFHNYPHLGFKIACLLYDKEVYEQGLYNIKICKNVDNIKAEIKNNNISIVVLAEDLQKSQELRSQLFSAIHLGVNFTSLNHFYEKIMGKIPVQAINQMWFLENLNEGSKFWFDYFKRLYDVILAFAILIITIPFWPIIGLIITLESRGSMFYSQKRVGINNKIIHLTKFRTMIETGNTRRPTVPNDSRVTRLGGYLRRMRIDEIPQVINIIKGDMSFIGPRPERPELVVNLQKEIPFYNERTLVLPGVTGWDQVCGEYHSPSTEDTIKKLQYDLFYIKNRSVFLDLLIILKTLRTVVLGKGR
ncbi:MAG: sugar transferase [bacterium]|nr:sugar transferase [bacterium]